MPFSAADRQSFEDFCALQTLRVHQTLDRRVKRTQERKALARKQTQQQLCDMDLDAQPFAWTSALGPRARSLSELEGDERD